MWLPYIVFDVTTYTSHTLELAIAIFALLNALVRSLRWRRAKALGMSRSQFASLEAGGAGRLLKKARLLTALGWIFICLPLILAAVSLTRNREPIFTAVAEIALLELICFAPLGGIFLWLGSQQRETAREAGAAMPRAKKQ